jgi:hypothetical protein
MTVVTPKYEKSVICRLGRLDHDDHDPDAGTEMTLL